MRNFECGISVRSTRGWRGAGVPPARADLLVHALGNGLFLHQQYPDSTAQPIGLGLTSDVRPPRGQGLLPRRNPVLPMFAIPHADDQRGDTISWKQLDFAADQGERVPRPFGY